MSTLRGAIACFVLLCLTVGCGQPRSLTLTPDFEDATRDASAAVFIRILEGGCGSAQPEVYSSSFPTGDPESAAPVRVLSPGTYGFEIEARNAACEVIARICVMHELPLDDDELIIAVPDQPAAPACDPSECSNGQCTTDVSPDAGPPPEDSGPPGCDGDGDCPDGTCHDRVCCFGCWDGSSCQPGTGASACGVAGGACATCSASQACLGGECLADVDPVSIALAVTTSYVRIGTELWSAGDNASSQRGELVSATENVFVQQDTTLQFRTVATTQLASCGIDLSGDMHCWGGNALGLLGIGTTGGTFATPQAVTTGGPWREIEGGNLHFCALNESEQLFCWGQNSEGQLGIAGGGVRPSPAPVAAGGTWRAVSPGDLHTCAIRVDGRLFCWGSAAFGKLGVSGATGGETAVQVGTASDWTAVSAGVEHTCGIRGGELFCWGNQQYGRLGNGADTMVNIEEPLSIDDTRTWVDVAAGQFHTCGLVDDGTVYCWGLGAATGTGGSASVPTEVTTLGIAATAIDTGWGHTCAVAEDEGAFAGLRCWGSGASGVLGDGSVNDQGLPIEPTLEPSP